METYRAKVTCVKSEGNFKNKQLKTRENPCKDPLGYVRNIFVKIKDFEFQILDDAECISI